MGGEGWTETKGGRGANLGGNRFRGGVDPVEGRGWTKEKKVPGDSKSAPAPSRLFGGEGTRLREVVCRKVVHTCNLRFSPASHCI